MPPVPGYAASGQPGREGGQTNVEASVTERLSKQRTAEMPLSKFSARSVSLWNRSLYFETSSGHPEANGWLNRIRSGIYPTAADQWRCAVRRRHSGITVMVPAE